MGPGMGNPMMNGHGGMRPGMPAPMGDGMGNMGSMNVPAGMNMGMPDMGGPMGGAMGGMAGQMGGPMGGPAMGGMGSPGGYGPLQRGPDSFEGPVGMSGPSNYNRGYRPQGGCQGV